MGAVVTKRARIRVSNNEIGRWWGIHYVDPPKWSFWVFHRELCQSTFKPICLECGERVRRHRHRSNYDGFIGAQKFGPFRVVQEIGGCFGPKDGCHGCGTKDGQHCDAYVAFTYVSRLNPPKRRRRLLARYV